MQQSCHSRRELQESSLAALLGVCKGHVSVSPALTHVATGCLRKRLHA